MYHSRTFPFNLCQPFTQDAGFTATNHDHAMELLSESSLHRSKKANMKCFYTSLRSSSDIEGHCLAKIKLFRKWYGTLSTGLLWWVDKVVFQFYYKGHFFKLCESRQRQLTLDTTGDEHVIRMFLVECGVLEHGVDNPGPVGRRVGVAGTHQQRHLALQGADSRLVLNTSRDPQLGPETKYHRPRRYLGTPQALSLLLFLPSCIHFTLVLPKLIIPLCFLCS